MFQQKLPSNSPDSLVRAIILIVLFLVIFIISLGIAAFLLLGPGPGSAAPAGSPVPGPNPTPTTQPEPLVTPVAGSMTRLRNVALGFAVDYPSDWAKKEQTLAVTFSPDPAGLEPESWQEATIRLGIPANGTADSAALLEQILAGLPDHTQVLDTGTMNIAGQSWRSARVRFEPESLGRPALATIAATSRDEVGYFIVAAAPADRWPVVNPIFQGIINSFRFTAEAVIRPTSATRPPTPTPSPTPRVYVVQSGDTLSEIAVQFGVTTEALAARNGIEDPRSLRTGQKLIIPNRR